MHQQAAQQIEIDSLYDITIVVILTKSPSAFAVIVASHLD